MTRRGSLLLIAVALSLPTLAGADERDQEKSRYLRIATVSLPSDPQQRTLDDLLEWIAQAGREEASLVCFPRNSVAAEPEPIPGPISRAVAERARTAGGRNCGNGDEETHACCPHRRSLGGFFGMASKTTADSLDCSRSN